ncbi:MAG TPA: hypothetical protein VK752_10745 [Bryobacteraceae bacterium]|jgi:hypothetical protein|nr:hypothetical protein [Bryobacteraceae bacterium]
MSTIYSIKPDPAKGGVTLDQVWTGGALASGYSNFVPVNNALFAYNKSTDKTDVYTLSSGAPWIAPSGAHPDLSGGPWDNLSTFVLGNQRYLLTYRRDNGTFGFYSVNADLSVSPPYLFVLPRNTPSKGFTEVAPFSSIGQQFVLGYDHDTGHVANFSVAVISSSAGGVPPLLALNIWDHHWAKNWTCFAFFQLGGANFFFKINRVEGKVNNVNIDHIQDNPAMGTVEIGTYLQEKLPDALSISIVAPVPWDDGEPYLLTYIASSGATVVYRIHADCQGWTSLNASTTIKGATQAVPYRIGNATYVLFYQ